MDDLSLFKYEYVDNNAPRTLFLFHGTGGDRHDFLFLDRLLNHSYNLVGLQGNVLENGMPRFFKRHSLGVFDQDSIREEVEKLGRFTREWTKKYDIDSQDISFLGYSNGANMILATLLTYPALFNNLVLLHPILPFFPTNETIDLSTHKIFISMGLVDPIVSPDEQKIVVQTLERLGAELLIKHYSGGHEVSDQEIEDVVSYLLST